MTTTIYDTIIANIQADPKAWCVGTYQTTEDGKHVSACLVGHVDLALHTCYIRGFGRSGRPRYFVSKDQRKWTRRHRVIAHLANLIGPSSGAEVVPGPNEPIGTFANDYPAALHSFGEVDVTEWNDDETDDGGYCRVPDEVIDLLRTAANTYPND